MMYHIIMIYQYISIMWSSHETACIDVRYVLTFQRQGDRNGTFHSVTVRIFVTWCSMNYVRKYVMCVFGDFGLTLFIWGRPVGLACCHDAKDYPSCSTTMLQRATSTSGFLDFCAVNLANNRHTFKRFYVTYLIRFKLLIRFKFLQVKQVVDLSQVYGEVRLEAKRGLVFPDYSTTIECLQLGNDCLSYDETIVRMSLLSLSLINYFHALLWTLNRFKF